MARLRINKAAKSDRKYSLDYRTDFIRGMPEMITPDQTIDLLRRYHDPLTTESEKKILKDQIVNGNLRLILSVIRMYRREWHGSCLHDLFQSGVFGLIQAVDKFSFGKTIQCEDGTSKPHRFSTIAFYYIYLFVSREELDHGRTIKLPNHMQAKTWKVLTRLQEETASYDNLYGSLDDRVRRIAETMDRVNPDDLVKAMKTFASLSFIDDHSNEVSDFDIAYDEDTEDSREELELFGDGLEVLKLRYPRYYETLVRRYGMAGHDPQTLLKIGKHFGVSRERARQIQIKAEEKLKLICLELQDSRSSIRLGTMWSHS